MPKGKPQKMKGTCFVVMGFGTKKDYQAESIPPRELNLDKTYHSIIKPAAEGAGLKCVRADELVHSGLIDQAMYEQLLSADVVIADISTSNSNAFYELGVRHALRPSTTVVICEDGLTKEGRDKLPFDVNHVVVRKYKHLGTGLDYDEVVRFRKVLKNDILKILKKQPPPSDSPVYAFLIGLKPPVRAARAAKKIGQKLGESLGTGKPAGQVISSKTHSILIQQSDDAHQKGEFEVAIKLLTDIRKMRPDDADITHRLVVATYKSKQPTRQQANKKALKLLKTLHPEKSSDPRTLGLWGTVNERLWNDTGDEAYLDEALSGYERSFNHSRDYFNGIHEAFLLNVRASKSDNPAEAIADFILAQRIRREVIPACKDWLKSTKPPNKKEADPGKRKLNDHLKEKSWVLATIAEAYMGMGDEAKAQQFFDKSEAVIRQLLANGYAPFKVGTMRDSTQQKRAELQALLAASPLKYVKTGDE